jgi:hypothetical protein
MNEYPGTLESHLCSCWHSKQKIRCRLSNFQASTQHPAARLLGCRLHRWPFEQTLHPSSDVRQVETDCYLIPLASDEERNVGDIGERVLVGYVISILHLSIQVLQILPKLRPRLFDLIAVGNTACGLLHASVTVVNPNSYARARERILWHQRHVRVFFVQVLIDDGGLVNNRIAVNQHRNFAIRI